MLPVYSYVELTETWSFGVLMGIRTEWTDYPTELNLSIKWK